MILVEEIKDAVFRLISKHSSNINFLCIFFMNYIINEFEKKQILNGGREGVL